MSPVVSTQKIILHKKDFTLKVSYSPRHFDFYIKLPEYMANTMGYKEIRDDSQKSVEAKFGRVIKEYNEITAYTEKVIFYRFLSRVRLYGTALGEDDMATTSSGEMHSYGIALDLWFLVGHTVTNESGEVIYYDENMKKWGSRRSFCSLMDWTEDREAFFKGARDVIADQIKQMHDFFWSDKEALAQLIDQGMTGMKFLTAQSDGGGRQN